MNTHKYICIHGHFYQPPRENPWMEAIEIQDSAYPFHDWNERITAECYAQNAASRILGANGTIVDIVNNYSRMSFNFGPTLLSWMEQYEPETYQAILQADRDSRDEFSGHGSALAQVYGHLIMPLASRRDKITQVKWGVADFEYRFGRKPEGIWLAETAVDTETLEILAQFGIKFTLLAPRQAKAVRKIGTTAWQDVSGDQVDPRMPYRCQLPSGRSIAVYFYDGNISQDIAFKGLLKSGRDFADRLNWAFRDDNAPQLVNVATDGESYGHHHRHGDMALAYCMHHIETHGLARITNYGEFLALFPPTHEAQIFENSSWSCVHGVERWRNDCGCNTGGEPGWRQHWRKPLREALDWLRAELDRLYEGYMPRFVKDPWALRDAYIKVVLDRSADNVQGFLREHGSRNQAREDQVLLLKLLEMQRHAMQMYTSCGWFFNEVSGIETVQILQYASRAIQLAEEVATTKANGAAGSAGLEAAFIGRLGQVPSNRAEFTHAATLYAQMVRPARMDLVRAGAHYAIASLFEERPANIPLYSYLFRHEVYDRLEAGVQKLVIGESRVESALTGEEREVSYAVLYLGQHTIIANARENMPAKQFEEMHLGIRNAFLASDVAEVIRLMDVHSQSHRYSLQHLFKDAQRKVIEQLMGETMRDIETSFRQVYEHHYHMMNLMNRSDAPLPGVFRSTVEFVLNADVRNVFEAELADIEELKRLAAEAKRWKVTLDSQALGRVIAGRVETLFREWDAKPSVSQLSYMVRLLGLLKQLGLRFDLWKVQNEYYFMGNRYYGEIRDRAERGEAMARQWVHYFAELGTLLEVKVV
jgi:alpha-amylase/alpha-mannosidase (GH57 family)